MKILLYFLLFIAIIPTEGIAQENTRSTESMRSLQEEKIPNDLSKWLLDQLEINIPIESLLGHELNLTNYNNALKVDFINEIHEPYWLGQYTLNKVDILPAGVIINLSDDDYEKYILLSENYLIISYHLNMVAMGETIIYDLKTNSYESFSDFFAYGFINKNLLQVSKDYYDPRGEEHPDYVGRIFETGSFNLVSKKYTLISKE